VRHQIKIAVGPTSIEVRSAAQKAALSYDAYGVCKAACFVVLEKWPNGIDFGMGL